MYTLHIVIGKGPWMWILTNSRGFVVAAFGKNF